MAARKVKLSPWVAVAIVAGVLGIVGWIVSRFLSSSSGSSSSTSSSSSSASSAVAAGVEVVTTAASSAADTVGGWIDTATGYVQSWWGGEEAEAAS